MCKKKNTSHGLTTKEMGNKLLGRVPLWGGVGWVGVLGGLGGGGGGGFCWGGGGGGGVGFVWGGGGGGVGHGFCKQ